MQLTQISAVAAAIFFAALPAVASAEKCTEKSATKASSSVQENFIKIQEAIDTAIKARMNTSSKLRKRADDELVYAAITCMLSPFQLFVSLLNALQGGRVEERIRKR